MHADQGDYIITGLRGEQYPCKPDVFERTYEEVPGSTPLSPTISSLFFDKKPHAKKTASKSGQRKGGNQMETPNFTKKDFLETLAPYEFVKENANDPFREEQLLQIIYEQAVCVGVRNFKKLYRLFRQTH